MRKLEELGSYSAPVEFRFRDGTLKTVYIENVRTDTESPSLQYATGPLHQMLSTVLKSIHGIGYRLYLFMILGMYVL